MKAYLETPAGTADSPASVGAAILYRAAHRQQRARATSAAETGTAAHFLIQKAAKKTRAEGGAISDQEGRA